jgi:hypothetical protein
MKYFVKPDSIIKQIWGKADTVLFIFAGAAAEFALNKAVDWLYFTGKLPADPLGRLFSTVTYAQQIIFAEHDDAVKAIDKITAIHQSVEAARGARIPDWAYRDVLFMLIDYSIRSFEVLERELTGAEKDEVFDVFYRMGQRMQLAGLPVSYAEWRVMRREHLHDNLVKSHFTIDLFKQYRKHLGAIRYLLLKQVQLLVVPSAVRQLLPFKSVLWIKPLLLLYRWSRLVKADYLLKQALLPSDYKVQIRALDMAAA